jgi:hypothetical protein
MRPIRPGEGRRQRCPIEFVADGGLFGETTSLRAATVDSKPFGRIAMRYDKLARNFFSAVCSSLCPVLAIVLSLTSVPIYL